ncbi:NAD(P)H-dependent flavin oxidoreductase [Brevibacterium sp. UCMA 11754]|uniref:NAD(P)H-dependent flavin oxidoreductase n=1 Tax=Brevibacterium sp. UCMA 11754 TaxID=2749198 RepID=UPI001F31182A|nr:hypothetical protein [Brevibacterium sp. UCMA 11754]
MHTAARSSRLAAGAATAPYVGSAFLSTAEANVTEDYKQMIVDSAAEDVVYSSYFTGVKGNYLRGSITASGLDPDDLPEADPTKMDFGTKEGSDSKAWKDIWGSGQGIGVLHEKSTAAELVDSLTAQFEAAKTELDARLNTAVGVG